MLLPYRIDTLFKHLPVANWVIMGLTVLWFFLLAGGALSEDLVDAMVLEGWGPAGLAGHLFLHGGLSHLAGNMLFLWVFGNAICANTSNRAYPVLYLGFGLAAAVTHLVLDGDPAVGASGAINGVVGMAVAMYPLNRVSLFWFFLFRFGTFQMPLWGLALMWCLFDMWGALRGGGNVAYWAHLGGFFAGLGAGCLCLRRGWVELTRYDNQSLEEMLSGKTVEERRERLLAEEAEEDREESMSDPRVLTVTSAAVAKWSELAGAQVVSEADAELIRAGGAAGERRNFELLYGRAFVALGYSFHHSLADYYTKVAEGRLWPHETAALARLLRMVEEDFPAMEACGFIDAELAGRRDATKLAAFFRATQPAR